MLPRTPVSRKDAGNFPGLSASQRQAVASTPPCDPVPPDYPNEILAVNVHPQAVH